MNNSCLDGMGALGSLDSNNKKARVVKDEGCLSWTRCQHWLQLNQKEAIVSLQEINKSCFNGKGAL